MGFVGKIFQNECIFKYSEFKISGFIFLIYFILAKIWILILLIKRFFMKLRMIVSQHWFYVNTSKFEPNRQKAIYMTHTASEYKGFFN